MEIGVSGPRHPFWGRRYYWVECNLKGGKVPSRESTKSGVG